MYEALKQEVAARRLVTTAWVTSTQCLGICPQKGATVARYPGAAPILTEVVPADVDALLDLSIPRGERELSAELDALEVLQKKKVLDLARRLKPGLTMEDVQNPHDFPELADPDWHYADGVLTGIASVKTLLSARSRDHDEAGDASSESPRRTGSGAPLPRGEGKR